MPNSWRNHSDAPPSLVVQTLIRSTDVEVQHWARVAHGNLEAAAALGPLVAFCAADTPVEPVDMTTMSTLVSHLRARDATSTLAVRRLTASAVANLLVSSHNQRLVIECNGIKPLVSLCQEAPEPELQVAGCHCNHHQTHFHRQSTSHLRHHPSSCRRSACARSPTWR